jgi:myo-inositol-1(or 4)-monophosphatase
MNLLGIAEDTANKALTMVKMFMEDAGVISSKGKDIKTRADMQLSIFIISQLEQTGIPIITEEAEYKNGKIPRKCWIIDPIDGTLNFNRKFPCVGISICLWEDNKPVIGVIKDIFNDLTYSSSMNMGARIGSETIQVSKVNRIGEAVLATGFPSGGSYATEDLLSFVKKVQDFKKIRAIGSASLMLSYVACGVFDAYFEKDIYLWDVAAGLSLVNEAGGKVYYSQKADSYKYDVLAANPLIFDEVKRLLIK